MKPVQLELINFGPYRNERINFEELEKAPLFLIGGDTGAGKSTIFDAMTVALFDVTTGERMPTEMRSTFATLDDPLTKVIFYFRHEDLLYRIVRVPKQERRAKRGTGVTEHKSEASLAIVDTVGGTELQHIASQPRNVGEEITQLLQLNAEQFKQIILLPQNEFRKFLISKTEDKLPILKNIFGTKLYETFTKQIELLYRDAKKKSERYNTDLEGKYASQVWTNEERQQFEAEADQYKESLAAQFVKQHHETKRNAEKTYQQAKMACDVASEKFEKAAVIAADFQRLADCQKNYQQEIIQQKEQYEKEMQHRKELEFAASVKDLVNSLDKAVDKVLSCKNELEIKQPDLLKKEKTLTSLIAKKNQLITDKTEIDTLKAQITPWFQLRTVAESVEEYHENKAAAETVLQKTTDKKTVLQQQLMELQNEWDTLESQAVTLEELALQEKVLGKLQQAEKDFRRLSKETTHLEKNQKEIVQQQKRFTKEMTALEAALRNQKNQLNVKLIDRRELMVAQLRLELKDGKPCEVCGAIEHPYAQTTLDANETKLKSSMEEVEDLKESIAKTNEKIEQINNRLLETADSLIKAQRAFSEKEIELMDQYNDFRLELKKINTKIELSAQYDAASLATLTMESEQHFQQSSQRLTEQKELAALLQKKIDQLKTDLQEVVKDDAKQQAFLKTATDKLTDLQNKYPDLASPESYTLKIEDAEKRIKAFEVLFDSTKTQLSEAEADYKELKGSLSEIKKNLKEESETADTLAAELQQTLKQPDSLTKEEQVVRTWLTELAQDQLTKLVSSITKYEEKQKNYEKTIHELSTKLDGIAVPDLESLEIQRNQFKQEETEALRIYTNTNRTLELTSSTLKEIHAIINKQGKHLESFQEIADLYNVIKGISSETGKLKLETYVVQEHLRRVLEHANRHYINQLTNGRYTFSLSNQHRDGARSDAGLDIDVFDFATGTIRSTKTLSGGETFIAALSIALSLSEVVQNTTNGVVIDALFVDEGFGSLDKDTLEKAMSALEQIGENRMVGVISHVEEMKERISQQLVIEKAGDGRSHIRVLDKN